MKLSGSNSPFRRISLRTIELKFGIYYIQLDKKYLFKYCFTILTFIFKYNYHIVTQSTKIIILIIVIIIIVTII